MFQFTNKEDSVGVGVYDVMLKYDRRRYMLTMGRKKEPLYKNIWGGYISLILPSINRAERLEKEVKLESCVIGVTILYSLGVNQRTLISGGNLWFCRTSRKLEVAFYRCQVMDWFLQPFFYVLVFYKTDIRLGLLDITEA